MEFRLTIPSSAIFDQSVMQHLLDLDPVVQDYRAFFALLDWSLVDPSMAMWCWPSTPCRSMKLTSRITAPPAEASGLFDAWTMIILCLNDLFQFPAEEGRK